jgi:acyl-CoA synthetase (AMP-forming)/AMP-acid ligase II
MRGYVDDSDATRAAFTADGWLRTGDVGRFAEDGRLEIVDRLKDLVISGGVNVSPTAVEHVLRLHPALADVCVVGTTDPEWGERVVAYAVVDEGCTAPSLDELRSFAREHLTAPELPRELRVIAAIPRTPSGKPLRRALR